MTLPLDTAPGPSADDEAARNVEISSELLAAARLELAAGDLLQAAEKAWAAAAFAVKAAGEKTPLVQRSRLETAPGRLGNRRRTGASGADGLLFPDPGAHFKLYRHEYSAREVEQAIDAAAALAALLLPTLACCAGPARATSRRPCGIAAGGRRRLCNWWACPFWTIKRPCWPRHPPLPHRPLYLTIIPLCKTSRRI